jgi:plastocyanin
VRRSVAAVLSAALLLLAAGCGESDAPHRAQRVTTTVTGGPAVRSAIVKIASFRFVPAAVTLTRGGRITWVDDDRAVHNAGNEGLAAPARFDTGRLDHGERKTIVFNEPGTYRYYCVFHRFMEAVVIVE